MKLNLSPRVYYCMSGGGPAAPPAPPPPPLAAPIMFGAKEQETPNTLKNKNKIGKARLQIPLTPSATTGLGIPNP